MATTAKAATQSSRAEGVGARKTWRPSGAKTCHAIGFRGIGGDIGGVGVGDGIGVGDGVGFVVVVGVVVVGGGGGGGGGGVVIVACAVVSVVVAAVSTKPTTSRYAAWSSVALFFVSVTENAVGPGRRGTRIFCFKHCPTTIMSRRACRNMTVSRRCVRYPPQ